MKIQNARTPIPGSRRTGAVLPASLLALLLAACGDEGPATPTLANDLRLTVATTELELGDSVQVSAHVLDASGQTLTGRPITWSSGDPSVLEVRDNGVAVGVGPGSASVTAAVDGRTASVNLTVLPWNIAENVAVIDSMRLRLVSDSAERAAGRLRFEVLQGPVPAFAPGTIVVGAQGAGFLRRVTSASSGGGEVTVETTTAALSGAVEAGGFASRVNLIFEPGTPASAMDAAAAGIRPGEVIWGEGRFTYMAPGVRLTAAAGAPVATFNLSGLDVCELLKDASSGSVKCPDQLKKLEIKSGRLDFEPDFDVEANFSGFSLEDFRGVLEGSLTADVMLALAVEGSLGSLEAKPKFFTFTRPFFAAIGPVPVVGYIELELTGELSLAATANGAMEAGYAANGSLQIGAEYENESWSPVFEGDGSFDPHEPAVEDGTLSGSIEITAKVSMKPRRQMIFYGVIGPFAEATPFGEAKLTFGTTCGFSANMALNAAIGFTIPFLDDDIADFAHKEEPLLQGPEPSWPCPLGTIDVNTTTNGQNVDPDGYTVLLDGESKGSVGTTDQLVIPFVQVGQREVTLDGVAANCSVQNGASRTVTVQTGGTHGVQFSVDCTALTGKLEITTNTTGPAQDPDGYTVTIDGGSGASIGTNETLVIENVAEGTHSVELGGVESNCTVSGANPATVDVVADQTASVRFHVQCAAAELVVRTAVSGPPGSTSGWVVTLDGTDTRTIAPNGQVTYQTTPGQHNVLLDGLPANCLPGGDNPVVVDVAPTGSTEHTFDVTCQGGDLTVSVATDTTDGGVDEETMYTVVAGGQSRSLAINDVVEFSDLPEGPVSVRLDDVPGHCTVQGLNPREAQVPGAVTFEVICQETAQCSEPPDNGHSIWTSVGISGGDAPWSTNTAEVDTVGYGIVAGSVSAASSDPDRDSKSSWVDIEWQDHLNFIPTDPGRIEESVTLRFRHVGHAEITRSGAARTESRVSVKGDWTFLSGRETEEWPTPQRVDFDKVVELPIKLGEWSRIWGEFVARASAFEGGSTSASGNSTVTLIDVRDENGQLVPIASFCSSSGALYGTET